MSWPKFLISNFLGAVVWVTAISGTGYLFGRHWDRLQEGLKRFDIAALAVVLLAAAYLWWRNRNNDGAASSR